jgi:oxygen-independent coproporphyrinogen-3 oxidase
VLETPPLSLYVHLPWCVSKCPYCDFNSHAAGDGPPTDDYVDALLSDLECELPLVWGRPVQTIFFGGGTPSLFGADQIERLLNGFRGLLTVRPHAEITLEANPGTLEHDSFQAYRDAGINRVSLGVQSFSDAALGSLGRIHGREEALRAVESVGSAGLGNFNVDLMFALPGQTLEEAVQDIREAIARRPPHLSHYQLTIEPNTAFAAHPPELPDADLSWAMQEACGRLLETAGYRQYEISAWAQPGHECRHNLNYWQYGDFMGIGAGAHGKLTLAGAACVRRRVRLRHPVAWMAGAGDGRLAEDRELEPAERSFEFFLNQLRLRRGVRISQFQPRTGLPWEAVADKVEDAVRRGLLARDGDWLRPTDLGWRFGNDTQAIFLP